MFNREAYEDLQLTERDYLRENGWIKDSSTDRWSNAEFDRYDLVQGHAVNTQKQFDRICMRVLAAEGLSGGR